MKLQNMKHANSHVANRFLICVCMKKRKQNIISSAVERNGTSSPMYSLLLNRVNLKFSVTKHRPIITLSAKIKEYKLPSCSLLQHISKIRNVSEGFPQHSMAFVCLFSC